jgi:hypothetical protein
MDSVSIALDYQSVADVAPPCGFKPTVMNCAENRMEMAKDEIDEA